MFVRNGNAIDVEEVVIRYINIDSLIFIYLLIFSLSSLFSRLFSSLRFCSGTANGRSVLRCDHWWKDGDKTQFSLSLLSASSTRFSIDSVLIFSLKCLIRFRPFLPFFELDRLSFHCSWIDLIPLAPFSSTSTFGSSNDQKTLNISRHDNHCSVILLIFLSTLLRR